MIEREYFINTLDSMKIHGVKRRYWLKILHTQPDKVASLFFQKLDREYQNQRHWEIAKILLLKNHPHLAPEPEREPECEPEPEEFPSGELFVPRSAEVIFCKNVAPQYNLEYFLRINGGRWGCAMEDIDEYERQHGIII